MNEETMDRATFTRMDEGTKDDWDKIGRAYYAFADGLVDRVLDHMRLLDGDFGGFNCDRLTHSLQTATRAYRDGKDEEYVVCALLHDIGDAKFHDGVERSGAFARQILGEFAVEPAIIDHIAQIVDNLSFRKGAEAEALSLEGQIVQDADRLDALGAIGIVRAIEAAGGKVED